MKSSTVRQLIIWTGGVLLLYLCIQFALTHVSLPKKLQSAWKYGIDLDKLLHTLAYAILAIIAGCWRSWGRQPTQRELAVVGLAILAYAAFDELTQIPVGRHADPMDWLFDAIGTFLGLSIVWVVWRFGPRWLSHSVAASD